jgi:flagellin
MGLRINQNIAATNAYRNLSVTDSQMQKSLEKLSSGFRINRAADDAAGLSISEGLRAQVGGLKVAVRNAQDGISVVQTAEGALTEVHSILQRMRDLSVQASNDGSQDGVARKAAQTEFDQLNQELDRIGSTTSFGKAHLLDGTYGLQGAKAAAGSQVTLSTAAVGSNIHIMLGSTESDGSAGTVTGYAVDVATLSAGALTDDTAGATKLQESLQTAIDANTNLKGKVEVSVQYDSWTGKASVSFHRTGATGAHDSIQLSSDVDGAGANSLGSLGYTVTNTTADVDDDGDGTDEGFAASTVKDPTGSAATFQVGANNTAADKITVSISKVDSTALNTGTVDLVNDAASALDTIDAAISQVSTTRSNLGAFQNRFEHAINNLSVAVENLSASESRIRDTDMAAEMVSFTRAQILSQAGTAMLAQANQAPQSVLQLLRG